MRRTGITGSWTPFIPVPAGVGLLAAVAALTVGAVMIPFGVMSRPVLPTITVMGPLRRLELHTMTHGCRRRALRGWLAVHISRNVNCMRPLVPIFSEEEAR